MAFGLCDCFDFEAGELKICVGDPVPGPAACRLFGQTLDMLLNDC